MAENPSSSTTEHPAGENALRGRLLAAFIVLPGFALLSLLPLRPPAVIGDSAPPGEFSAGRALTELRSIARAPHPIGSAEHARVREDLVRRIEELGLRAEIQTETVTGTRFGRVSVVRVANVLTRLEGDGGGDEAVLLTAHYDSVPYSPAAGDDGAGVAALLETLRALRSQAPLKNDLIFLFSDGEEAGLMGVRAFAQHHRWAADVRLVINYEARGARGPSIMFETGKGTGPLLRRFAAAVAHPVAYSYAYDVYRILPNDTDFSIFRRRLPGFNFAFIHDSAAYHSPRDNVERLDPRSLQHHGESALALSRSFGAADLASLPEGPNAIYFRLPALGLVIYPITWAIPVLVLLVLLAAAVFYRTRGHWRLSKVLLGLLAFPAAMVAGCLAVLLLAGVLTRIFRSAPGDSADASWYLGGMLLVAVAGAYALLLALGKWLGAANLSVSGAVWWLLLSVAATLYLPSTSYLLVWPLVFSLIALALFFAPSRPLGAGGTPWAVLVVAALPALLLWAPTLTLIGTALGVEAATWLAVPVALLANLLSLQLALLAGESRRWLLPAAALVLGLVLALPVVLQARASERVGPNSLFYALDTADRQAVWASFDGQRAAGTSPLLPQGAQVQKLEGFFRIPVEVLAAEAPVLPLPPPVVQDLTAAPENAGEVEAAEETEAPETETAETEAAQNRQLSLRVESPRRASRLQLELRSESALRSLAIDGRQVDIKQWTRDDDSPPGHWRADYFGVSPDGFELEVGLVGSHPLEVIVVDRVYVLPGEAGVDDEPPADAEPPGRGFNRMSVVKKAFVF